MSIITEQEFVTTSEAGRIAGVSGQQIRGMANAGRLPFVWTPLGRLFERKAVEEYAVKRQENAMRRKQISNLRG